MELKAYNRQGTQDLAQKGLIPAVAYNKDKNISFAVEAKAFDRVFRAQSTHGLVELQLEGGETLPALVKSVQMDKRRRVPVHADFFLVTYGQEIEAPVPVHTTGKAKGVAENGGILDVLVHNLSIIAPGPRRIPAEIVVDVTKLDIGDVITAGDIQLPENIKLAVDPSLAVVTVLPPQKMAATSDEAEGSEQTAASAEE
ncbi:large subunit ribosomal protein L25 [Deinobacterium chartae]|uniref:Large ribosomal subunit protein bL25 n=1 Tax=Deinobacterium chartae TaxID=521158 RepID=A0A841HWY2_9DEIO|nr:50S ribosomal protein L25 [Deinobacterium chartae]MBB6097426.1 large subunit ribosomal protein L25 [Deinobacterium chartae]